MLSIARQVPLLPPRSAHVDGDASRAVDRSGSEALRLSGPRAEVASALLTSAMWREGEGTSGKHATTCTH
eukprot:1883648-Prymnesium_polylepis.1